MNGTSEVAAVWRMANELVAQLQSWIELKDSKTMHLTLSKTNQLKLLKLKVWEQRYQLPVQEILDMVIPILRDRVRLHRGRYGLGIHIASLCGAGAETILRREIRKRYPDNEHRAVWKEAAQQHQLDIEASTELDGIKVRNGLTLLKSHSLASYVTAYKHKVLTARELEQVERNKPMRRRKHYRNNPWL